MQFKFKVLLFSILGLVVLVQFTNCASHQQDGVSVPSKQCLPSSLCASPRAESLHILHSSNKVISDLYSSKKNVLVSGACSSGDFENHKIEVSYARDGNDIFSTRKHDNACINGRFFIDLLLSGPDLGPNNNIVHVGVKIYGIKGIEETPSPYDVVYKTYLYQSN